MNGYYSKFSSSGQYWFNLKSNNHEIILRSEGYTSSSGRDNGIESVRENSPFESRYDRRISMNKKYYFNLKASNGEVIGTSEMYETSHGRDEGIKAVKRIAPTADIRSSALV